jgi:hypothetical protein
MLAVSRSNSHVFVQTNTDVAGLKQGQKKTAKFVVDSVTRICYFYARRVSHFAPCRVAVKVVQDKVDFDAHGK